MPVDVRVLRGVYADPSLPRDHLLRCRAAALLMLPGAALGARSAAAVLGAPAPGYADPVTVVLPVAEQWRGPTGVRVHRAPLRRDEVIEDGDGLRHTEPLRTAWDVAASERTVTAVGVLDAMVRARSRLAQVDFAWPEARPIVEYEGECHFGGLQIARDDVRLRRLVEAGWRVIRLVAHDLCDMDAVVARIAAELARSSFAP